MSSEGREDEVCIYSVDGQDHPPGMACKCRLCHVRCRATERLPTITRGAWTSPMVYRAEENGWSVTYGDDGEEELRHIGTPIMDAAQWNMYRKGLNSTTAVKFR